MVLLLLDQVVQRAAHVAVGIFDEPLGMQGGLALCHVGLEALVQAIECGLALE